ncbi:MAG TPA: hypothetical protein VM734_08580 [Kofleriaceae bacterium]|nr:hypothetical protein [Kofleriaceae bacterium]
MAVLVVLDEIEPEKPRPVAVIQPKLEILPADTIEATPIDIELFTAPTSASTPPPPAPDDLDDPIAPPPPPAARAAATNRATEPAPSAASGAATPEPGGTEPPPSATGPGKLSMRDLPTRPAAPRLDLRGATYELPPEGSPEIHPPEYRPPEPTGELAPSGGGTYTSHRPGFTGKVAPDGKVSIEDGSDFSINLKLPTPSKVRGAARNIARGLETWQRDPTKKIREAERTGEEVAGADPTDADKKPDHGGTVPILGGRFNADDWIMKKGGIDPYQAEKLAWMDRTRDERAEMGRAHRARALDRTGATIQKHLVALWARTDLDIVAKRAALFELWDDCAEHGEPAVVEAGEVARKAVIGFIRSRVPAGSAHAYPDAELASFNRRRVSRAVFAPYD